MDFNSIEVKGSRKKIQTLSYRYGNQDDPKNSFILDSYAKGEVAIDCDSNKYIVTQTDIYDNNYKVIDSAFFGDWRLLTPSQNIETGTVLSILKVLACQPQGLPELKNKNTLEKFWSATSNVNIDGADTKIINTSSYDKLSFSRSGEKATVLTQVTFSMPYPLFEPSNLKYREMIQASNLYKTSRMDRLLIFNCKEDIVEESNGYHYSELLISPIQVTIFKAEKLLPLGSFDVLKKIACKEM